MIDRPVHRPRKVIEANILLSGLAFECGGLAAARGIYRALTCAPEAHASMYGEKVKKKKKKRELGP